MIRSEAGSCFQKLCACWSTWHLNSSSISLVPTAPLPLNYPSFVWLIAAMRSQFVLTMGFLTTDVEGRGAPSPPPEAGHWDAVLAPLRLSREQLEECCLSYQMAQRCMVRARTLCGPASRTARARVFRLLAPLAVGLFHLRKASLKNHTQNAHRRL